MEEKKSDDGWNDSEIVAEHLSLTLVCSSDWTVDLEDFDKECRKDRRLVVRLDLQLGHSSSPSMLVTLEWTGARGLWVAPVTNRAPLR